MGRSSCPDHDKLQALADGVFNDQDLESLVWHLSECDACQNLLEALPERPLVRKLRDARVLLRGDETATHDETRAPSCGTVPAAWPEIPGHEILKQIGKGGMGLVYKARQVNADRIVALKVILDQQFASEADVRRFQIEAHAAAVLDHPHLVPVYEVGENDDGYHFYTMKFVDGQPLNEKVCDFKGDSYVIAALMERLALAVHHAHLGGIVHRDLKPGNILIDAHGNPHVTDFGLAKIIGAANHMTRTGHAVGTPAYMAPEQAAGRTDVGVPADVYGLGAILYELLTGQAPFVGTNPVEILRRVEDEDPRPPRTIDPGVNRDLETIALKCLAKDPNSRYSTAQALAEDLRRFLEGNAINARPEGVWQRVMRGITMNRLDGSDFKSWDTMLFSLAPIFGVSNLLIFLLRRKEVPPPWQEIVAVTGIVLAFWVLVRHGRRKPTEKEWQLITMFIANLVACGVLNVVITGLPFPLDGTILQPHWAVINGLCFFAVRRTHVGYFSVAGVCYFGLAIAMSYFPDSAALIYAIACTITVVVFGVYFRRHQSKTARAE